MKRWREYLQVPFADRLRLVRWLIPVGVLVLAALHQGFVDSLLREAPAHWHLWITLAIYGLTGSVVAWVGLSWIAKSVERRAEAEGELRGAFVELEQSHQKLLTLQQLGRLVSRAEDEQTVLEVAARGPLELTGAKGSTVITFDDQQEALKLDMAWGLSDSYVETLRRRVDSGISMERCRTCSPLASSVSTDCPLFVGMKDVAEEEGIRSLVCVPMVHEQDRVGVIAAYYPSPDGPPEDQIRLLNILGGAVGAVLDGMHLRARQMETLRHIDGDGESLSDTDALHRLGDQILEIAASGWGADSGGLFVEDGGTRELTCLAAHGLSDDRESEGPSFAQRLAGEAYASESPIIHSDLSALKEIPNTALLSAAAIPLVSEGRVFGVLFLGADRRRVLNTRQRDLLTAVSRHISLAVRNAQLSAELGRLAVTEERYRLSREIHDGLAQTLGYLGLQVERLASRVRRGESTEVEAGLAEIRTSIRGAYVDAREAIDGLRLSVERPEEISARLGEYLSGFSRQSGIEANFHAEPEVVITEPATAMQLLRITQEALTNVRKHSGAQSVNVGLYATGSELELRVSDDGTGFDRASRIVESHRTYGLSTMRERAASLNGAFSVATQPGQGTRITVTVPQRRLRASS